MYNASKKELVANNENSDKWQQVEVCGDELTSDVLVGKDTAASASRVKQKPRRISDIPKGILKRPAHKIDSLYSIQNKLKNTISIKYKVMMALITKILTN